MERIWNTLGEMLPGSIIDELEKIPCQMRWSAEELRLRTGVLPALLLPEGEKFFGEKETSRNDLAYILDRASRSSLHAVAGELRQGFISARKGIRIGVCGKVGPTGIESFQDVSSLAIRLPHEVRGAGKDIIEKLFPFDRSVLVISPPGGGKTTFLRELIRSASESGKRVALCDERGELAAMWRGKSSFDLGCHTDVLSGALKAEGITMLMRSMNPQIIAVDEISAQADIESIGQAALCGAVLFASVHGSDLKEMRKRPKLRELLSSGIFQRAVIISGRERRHYEVVEI